MDQTKKRKMKKWCRLKMKKWIPSSLQQKKQVHHSRISTAQQLHDVRLITMQKLLWSTTTRMKTTRFNTGSSRP
ncbi:Os05g0544900 [Oryza sativa Japonica Group]|uniref:Os05g0544900 protein n=1 Tax=Oryza sativa subsp. japonica TaxID=39947 RepID=Q65X39_ORYSJ|nr:unknown protein [Oryza sativa Japonica Group]AAU44009.1 unknown protein [Oryza sativa Japonica Group]BAH93238.1 Os05g0544900 [Oryza sativa Japonica Group]|eukprot:NP_001174510.1 Os05g0544900 [Oryza sativa Japonica Group]